MRAEDPDGIDSGWVSVDSVVVGEDGQLDRLFSWRFRVAIAPGKSAGTQIPIQVRARDGGGFQVTRDTVVVVVP